MPGLECCQRSEKSVKGLMRAAPGACSFPRSEFLSPLCPLLHQLLHRLLLLSVAEHAQSLAPHFAVRRVLLAAPLQLAVEIGVLNLVLRLEETIVDTRWAHLT